MNETPISDRSEGHAKQSNVRIRTSRLVGPVVLAAAALFPASVAHAHVAPTSKTVKVGTTASVGFKVEHGCDASPTIKLAIKLPTSVSNAVPVNKAGWTSTVNKGVVTFAGGSLPSKTSATFSVKMKFPTTAGDLTFPISQTCVKGSLLWADTTVAGQAVPDQPAPVVKVVK